MNTARFAAVACILAGCAIHDMAPLHAPTDATGGRAPRGFDARRACKDWGGALGEAGEAALSHASFPDADASRSCFVSVRYGSEGPTADAIPAGCGYPDDDRAATIARLEIRAHAYEAIAERASADALPLELACTLPEDVRRNAARINARTLRAAASRLGERAPYPYAAIAAFGYGVSKHGRSALLSFRPGDACPDLDEGELALLDVNIVRASRAAAAHASGIAPIVIVSGGAVHSPLTEAYLLDYLLTCRFGVPDTSVLLDPCADHTHTNMRNAGSLILAMGGRTAYLVTDDGMQSDYLEEWTLFDLIGGSIDQRSLRDFGYLLGSYRRASVGMKAGFWYTPYRFWAEPKAGLGSFTCIP